MDRILEIEWKRLMKDGSTCPRCDETGSNIIEAISALEGYCGRRGIRIVFEKGEIPEEEFLEDPSISNIITIDGKRLEDWIGGKVGKSKCCDECGDNDCRTIEVEDEVHEGIPVRLIVLASKKAIGAKS